MDRCFACDRPLSKETRSAQVIGEPTIVFVGTDCAKKISAMGAHGYQPPKGGPRLTMSMEMCRCYQCKPKVEGAE